jgi:taurine dioxygenase
MVTTSLSIRQLDPIGAEVLNLDLESGLQADTFGQLHDLLLSREVLLLRGHVQLADAMFARLGKQFGQVEGHPLGKFCPPNFPEILISSNGVKDGQPIGIFDIGQFWHTDGSYLPAPYMYTMLLGLTIPYSVDGRPLGDTMFLSATAAYDALTSEMKGRLEGLQAVYSYDYQYQQRLARNPKVLNSSKKKEDVLHPVIRKHPITGRKAIFVNEGYVKKIVGLSEADSNSLLKELFAHLLSPEFVYRHKWQPGDLLIWDNNSTQHCAVGDYAMPQLRYMKRVTIKTSSRQQMAA